MRILNNRSLLTIVVTLMLSSLPILCTPSLGLSIVLFAAVLLIAIKTTDLTAKSQDNQENWMDAEWHSSIEKENGHTCR